MQPLAALYEYATQMIQFDERLSALQQWLSQGFSKVSLDTVGLVFLAPLSTTAHRTALTGTSTLLDALIVCPGLHRQQDAPDLNKGEYPACAAMTTGYVFRVENPATVQFLQKVGRTAHSTTLKVRPATHEHAGFLLRTLHPFYDFNGTNPLSTLTYTLAISLSLTTLLLLALLEDLWALIVLTILILTRLLNVLIIRRRSITGWKGALEPGVKGDLLVLLSQDRWIRMRGAVDDLKAVTSGAWLREPTFVESSLTACATLVVYLDAVLVANAGQAGKVLLVVLMLCSAALLGVANECTDVLSMCGRVVEVEGRSGRYERRLDLAEELKKETGREDWAVRLGMVQPEKRKEKERGEVVEGVVTM